MPLNPSPEPQIKLPGVVTDSFFSYCAEAHTHGRRDNDNNNTLLHQFTGVHGNKIGHARNVMHPRKPTSNSLYLAPCGLRGCKNTAHSVSWPEVVKAVPIQGVDCFISYRAVFLFLFCVSGVCSVVFDCFWLSVLVQLIAWKDSSPKWPTMCRVGR